MAEFGKVVKAYAIKEMNLIVAIRLDQEELKHEIECYADDLEVDVDELTLVPLDAVHAVTRNGRETLVPADCRLGREAIAERAAK